MVKQRKPLKIFIFELYWTINNKRTCEGYIVYILVHMYVCTIIGIAYLLKHMNAEVHLLYI